MNMRLVCPVCGDRYHLVEHIVIGHNHNLRSIEHRLARERWEQRQQKVEDHVRFNDDWSGNEK